MKSRGLCLALATLLGVVLSPFHEHVGAQSGARILISEYRLHGPNGPADEFVELYNPGTADANVGGWRLRSANNGTTVTALATLPAGTVIRPGCFYLLANVAYSGASDGTYMNQTADNGGVAILNAT